MLTVFYCSSVFAADEFSQGYSASQAGNYKKAISLWKPLAEQGVSSAQYALAWMYESGQGVPKNDKQASYWYRKSAEQGNIAAQYVLATMYSTGKGVTLSHQQAVNWFLKAANQGDPLAQYKLGIYYQKGLGVKQNDVDSYLWFSKSAKQGLISAQISLGVIYQNGRGIEQNYKLAIKWFKKAATQGDSWAQYQLANMYEYGRGTPQDYALAKSLYLKSATNYAPSAYKIGEFYELGKTDKINFKEAIVWYKKAANRANSAAQFKLGEMYQNGTGVPQNINKAIDWYYQAAKQDNSQASYQLGTIYEMGITNKKGKKVIPIDYTKAAQYYQNAVKLEHHLAYARLAFLYENGFGFPINIEKAMDLYQKSTEKWAKARFQALAKQLTCLQKAKTKLFLIAITCTNRSTLDRQIKKQNIPILKEKSNSWSDTYFTGAIIPGSSELKISYTQDDLFAQAKYTFVGRNKPELITKLKNQLNKKYGKPSKQAGNVKEGEASFQWLLEDGIELTVNRGWPNTTTFITYSFPENFALLKNQKEQYQAPVQKKPTANKIDLTIF